MNTKYYCRTFRVPVNLFYVKPIISPNGEFRILNFNAAQHLYEIKATQTEDVAQWLDPNKKSNTFVRFYERPATGDIIYLLNNEHIYIIGGSPATLIGPYIWLEHTTTCPVVGSKVLDKYGLYPICPKHCFSSDRDGIRSVNERRPTVMFKLKTNNT